MGIDFAGPYSCLTIGYLEQTKLFAVHIPHMYSNDDAKMIHDAFKRYVDDGIMLWPKHLNIEEFIAILNQLDNSIRFTVERGQQDTEGKQ